MKKITHFLFLTVLLIGTAMSVRADVVEGLYSVAVDVQSQSSSELARAAKAGFEEVLVRVTGDSKVAELPGVNTLVGNARQYMTQYRYQSRYDEERQEQLQVLLEFAPKQMIEQLRQLDVPLWPANRPAILVWLVVDDRSGKRFASENEYPQVVESVSRQAARRGLAIKQPLYDLRDTGLASPKQMWQLDTNLLQPAQQRYGSDGLLVGRTTILSNGRWLGKWEYRFNDEQQTFDGDGADADDYIASVMDKLADLQASQFAIVAQPMATEGLIMEVVGLTDFGDYAAAVHYLEGLAAIRHANVIELSGSRVLLQLWVDGRVNQLQQALALDKKMQPVSAQSTDPQVNLYYEWQSKASSR